MFYKRILFVRTTVKGTFHCVIPQTWERYFWTRLKTVKRTSNYKNVHSASSKCFSWLCERYIVSFLDHYENVTFERSKNKYQYFKKRSFRKRYMMCLRYNALSALLKARWRRINAVYWRNACARLEIVPALGERVLCLFSRCWCWTVGNSSTLQWWWWWWWWRALENTAQKHHFKERASDSITNSRNAEFTLSMQTSFCEMCHTWQMRITHTHTHTHTHTLICFLSESTVKCNLFCDKAEFILITPVFSVRKDIYNVTKDSISNKTKHLEFVTMLKTVSYFFVETDTFYF